MSDPLASLYVHTIAVETFLRKGGSGDDVFAPKQILSPLTQTGVLVQGERKEVRGANGELQVSNTVVYAPLSLQSAFALDSRVTINGVPARVVTVNVNDLDSRFPQHLAVRLV